MHFCVECISERGRKSGEMVQARGLTGAPVSIPLNQGKYQELKSWLEREAEENERSLQQEIMFRLKRAMRKADVLG